MKKFVNNEVIKMVLNLIDLENVRTDMMSEFNADIANRTIYISDRLRIDRREIYFSLKKCHIERN